MYFHEIKVGQYFSRDGEIYQRIKQHETAHDCPQPNAIDVITGRRALFSPLVTVKPITRR